MPAPRTRLVSILAAAALAACGADATRSPLAASPPASVANAASPALRIALVAPAGTSALDAAIRATQARARERADVPVLERLATLFIGKARGSADPGFYKQAEACADAMPLADGGAHAAALVRGHVRHALHDFAAAERIARELVAARGMFLDHGLLGDVLLDLGRLAEARAVYQRMLDLKPGLQSYARAAQVRWLVGDLAGCRELLALAAKAGSERDPESLAWVLARNAQLELHANAPADAARLADQALALLPDYPAAHLARGRAALALGAPATAVPHLVAAAASYPLPEHVWAHADALRATGDAGNVSLAADVETELLRTGEVEDPRTFALWLATQGREPARALRLAEAEARARQDAHTLDVLALARLRTGDAAGAHAAMQQALATGVRDARVFLHAAMVADANGDGAAARAHRTAAEAGIAALLPSERELLTKLVRRP